MAKTHSSLKLRKVRESARSTQDKKSGRWSALATSVTWYVLVVAILGYFLFDQPYQALLGGESPRTVTAESTFQVDDEEATEAQRKLFEQNVISIWRLNGEVETRVRSRLSIFIDLLQSSSLSTTEELENVRQRLREQVQIDMSAPRLSQFLPSRLRGYDPPLTLREIKRDLSVIITDLTADRKIIDDKNIYQSHSAQGTVNVINQYGNMEAQPDPTRVLWWKSEVRDRLISSYLPQYFPGQRQEELRMALVDLMMSILEPNLTFDKESSQRFQSERLANLNNNKIQKVYRAGEVIVNQGEQLSKVQTAALEYLNEKRFENFWLKLSGIALMTAVIFFAVGAYLIAFQRDLRVTSTQVTLIVLPSILALALGQLMNQWITGEWMRLMFPSAMIGVLSALLINPRVAFILVLTTTVLFGVTIGQDLPFMILALFGGFAAVLASRNVRARIDVLGVGLKVGLVNMMTWWILQLIAANIPSDWVVRTLIVFLNGLIYPLVSLILLAVFEKIFGVVTDLRLLELTGDQHPLLEQLEEKAPGTYQHVLNVTKLAEAAAQEIGANYLLVRAGALFHDVGKMVKPKYFSENQVSIEDKKLHSRLSPYMSTLIIKNHVKEGIEIAQRAKLPQSIIEFIPQHHGTHIISYFHNLALRRYEESAAVDPVREEDFRYPGPKPQSIESAIVLISDSVEAIAASRFTGGQVSEDELRRTVQEAITTRFNDGQFDECRLTMEDLHKIRESLVKTLRARYHFRIAYPAKGGTDRQQKGGKQREQVTQEFQPIQVAGPAA